VVEKQLHCCKTQTSKTGRRYWIPARGLW